MVFAHIFVTVLSLECKLYKCVLFYFCERWYQCIYVYQLWQCSSQRHTSSLSSTQAKNMLYMSTKCFHLFVWMQFVHEDHRDGPQ